MTATTEPDLQARLRDAAKTVECFIAANDEVDDRGGIQDCIDSDDNWYQSAFMAGLVGFHAAHAIAVINEAADALDAKDAEIAERWMPIESAPKDGTFILGADKSLRFVWRLSYWTAKRAAEYFGGNPDEYAPGWFDERESEESPAFWRPLPAPPVQQTRKDTNNG